mgnify:CR=1 FL=1
MRPAVVFLVLAVVLVCGVFASHERHYAPDKDFLHLFGSSVTGSYTSSRRLVPDASVGGGISCAGCTIVVGVMSQLVVVKNSSAENVVDHFCDLLPVVFEEPCLSFTNKYGPAIIELLEASASADEVCRGIKICTDPTCNLFPASGLREKLLFANLPPLKEVGAGATPPPKETPWEWFIQQMDRVFNSHEPLIDIDSDFYSTTETFRGFHWRGRDCNDVDGSIQPGVATDSSSSVDSNCNGIVGEDGQQHSYEELFCQGSDAMGVAILGDSAAAHFHLPPSWLNATAMNDDTFKDLVEIASDEVDWPMMSWATGFMNSTWKGAPSTDPHWLPDDAPDGAHSIYLKMRERNRCIHRDYQNIAVNGARVGAMSNGIIHSFARNAKRDRPVLTFYALIGNDVCNGHEDTLQHMTTPAEFKIAVNSSLTTLNDQLPPGSVVMFIGLVDGRILYDSMHNKVHPIGSLYGDVDYASMYTFLNCLSISPCRGWLNTNETLRNLTSQRAAELSAVYQEVIDEYTGHLNVKYMPFALPTVLQWWAEQGGESWELIEPSDGFHPNQVAHALLSKFTWEALEKMNILPPENPHNADIEKIFGNQGGY